MGCCNGDTIDLVQYDTRPPLDLVLFDPDTNEPFDLSPPEVQVYFMTRPAGKKDMKTKILCQKLPGVVADDGTVTYPPAYSVPGTAGRVEVHWDSLSTDTAGQFDGTVVIENGVDRQTSVMTVRVIVTAAWGGVLPLTP